MKDAATTVVFHISRQQGQSLLHVGQDFRLSSSCREYREVSFAIGFNHPLGFRGII